MLQLGSAISDDVQSIDSVPVTFADVVKDLGVFTFDYNNNNNKHGNVYGAAIMAEPLREFTRFI